MSGRKRGYERGWHYSKPRETLDDTEELRIGKEHEKRIAGILADMGYTVTDISMRQHTSYKGELHYYPFDLLAVSPRHSFVADVKYKRSKASRIPMHAGLAKFQLNFKLDPDLPDVDDRIYIFCTSGLQDSFISLKDICSTPEDSCFNIYRMGHFYIIERYATQSISLLRKELEEIYK